MGMEIARTQAVAQMTRDDADSAIAALKIQVAQAKIKPYHEDVERQAAQALALLSSDGRLLLRHLLVKDRIEVSTRFVNSINSDVQFTQMSIACNSGLVARHEDRTGIGHLLRTEYVINPQFRAALEELLYRK